jgi:4-hydroxybenzoate polyprenyltransferase
LNRPLCSEYYSRHMSHIPLKNHLIGAVRLTRYKEILVFVMVTTLLGAKISGAVLDVRLLLVLVANWLAVGFSFMINDVEDAPDDALTPTKAKRNPVSAGFISRRSGYISSLIIALAACGVFALLGRTVFLLGVATIATGFFYSWKVVRFKRMPVVDMISHCMLLAGFQYLCAYLSFLPHLESGWVGPFILVCAISMYGELFNELRDFEGDKKAGVTHTASVLGKDVTKLVMNALLGIAAFTYIIIVVYGEIPLGIVAIMVLVPIIITLLLRKKSKSGGIGINHDLFQNTGALAMIVWVITGLV